MADYLSIVLNIQILKYCQKIDYILYTPYYFKRKLVAYLNFLIILGFINIYYDLYSFKTWLILFFFLSLLIICISAQINGVIKIIFIGKVLPGENLKVINVIDIEIELDNEVKNNVDSCILVIN